MLATCLLALAAVQSQPATVTLETPVINARAAVALVAEATGQKLAATPEMASEVVFLKVKDADYQGVLDRIAKVTFGKWVDREGVMTLTADAPARKSQADNRFTESMASIEKSLGYYENPTPVNMDDYGDVTAEEKQQILARVEVEHAQMRAFGQILRNVGVRRLALLAPGERIVYSDKPNAAQVRIGGPWGIFYDAIKRRRDDGEFGQDMGDQFGGVPPEMAEFMRIQTAYQTQVKPFDGVPVKFLLSVQRGTNTQTYYNAGAPSATIYAFDKNGSMTYVNNMSFDGEGEFADEHGISAPTEAGDVTVPEPQDPGRPLKFSKEESELGTGVYGSPMTEKTAKLIMDSFSATNVDPLDLIGGTVLRKMADVGEVDVVANVPDSIMTLRYMLAGEYASSVTYESTVESMAYSGMKIEDKEGWLEISPEDFKMNTDTRIDRPTLAAYAVASQKGPVPLDTTAEFAYQNPYSASNGLFQVLKEMSPSANDWMGTGSVAMLRFWGSLSDGQRQTLRSRGTIGLGSISKASRDLLAFYVYSAEEQLTPPPPEIINGYSLPARSMLTMFTGGSGSAGRSWISEPTESLPQGIPTNGMVKLEAWSEVCFVPESLKVNPMMPGVIGATELIMLDAYKLASPADAQEVMNALPTRAKLGRRTNMSISVIFTPQVQIAGQLNDIKLDDSGRVVSLSVLPDDVRASMDETRKELSVLETYMKYMIGSMGGGEGGQRPPP